MLNCSIPANIHFGNFSYFGDFLDYYIFWHNQIENNKSIKTICFQPTFHGLANKIWGMVSTLFFAMLTGRKFESIMHLFDFIYIVCNWPAYNSFFRTPFKIYNRVSNSIFIFLYTLIILEVNNTLIFMKCWLNYPDLQNLNLTEFDQIDYYAVMSNCRFLHALYNSKLFTYRLQEIGIDLRYYRTQDLEHFIYHLLLTEVFSLQDSLMHKVDSFSSNWINYCIIGIHIRTGDRSLSKNVPEKDEVNKYIEASSSKALKLSNQCIKPVKWYEVISIFLYVGFLLQIVMS